ncbi:PGF-pre-PGF domain-containing protein [Methanosarcina sp. 1.H.A.2.2]|uniref:PGF-pre-PGF domain-containing protein n=1 Tax=Methanosarcina sp. 1.H.A.2.2 TaxID=1483601 RepID=UPI000B0BB5A3|nr:PGF-pre-PGF domain-containing protein [Methanosarcina sp. 1.H.A.2.2]
MKKSNYSGPEEGVSIKTRICIFLLSIFLLSIFLLPTTGIAGSDEFHSGNVTISNEQVNIGQCPVNKETLFAAKYGPDWNVSIDRDSNLPRRIVGSSIELTGVSEKAEPEVRKFLADNSQIFGLDSVELELIKEDHDCSLDGNGSGISNIVYRQLYRGIPVYSSRIGVTVNDGKLVAVDSSYFPDIKVPTKASIDELQALSAAGSDLGIDIILPAAPLSSVSLEELSGPESGTASENKAAKAEQVSLVIYPVGNEGSYEYHLAYKIELAPLRDPLSAWVYFVDANDGQILYRYDRMISLTVNGNVTGTVYPECPADTPINVPFRNQRVFTFNEANESNNALYSGRFNNGTGYAVTFNPINLTGAVNSRFNFSTRYDIELDYDYAYAIISEDGNLFYSIGNFTGSQDSWADESIDISAYDGKQVWIGFFYDTDEAVLGDGFYADNITVSSENGVAFTDNLENGDENWDLYKFSLNKIFLNPVTTTDGNGSYNITGMEEDINLYSELSGPYVKVINEDETDAFVEFNLTSPTYDWNWADVDTSYKREESNVFYHVNVIHDFFTKGSPFNIHSMDYQAIATVEYGSKSGNAFSDGTNIYLFAAGGAYESTAVLSDVVYHEYIHSVVDHVYTTYLPYEGESGALDEGWADYFACTVNNNPIVGEGFYVSTGNGLRNLNNTYRYPDDIVGEVHYDSQIISGAMWDLREILGAELADELVLRGMKLEPQDFREYLEDILIVDDDNADLNDGTPHINAIFKAFYVNHGIDSEYFNLVAPEVSGECPLSGSFTPNNTTTIAANITDLIDIDSSSICMTVNGEPASLKNTEINNGYRVEHTPTIPYGDGAVTVCLNALDAAENDISHSWSFFVDTKSPLSNTPEDMEFSANSTAYFTGWRLFDSYPGYYWVLCDGEQVLPPVQWANGTNLSVPVNTDLGTGDFNYTIIYNDTAGNYGVQDTVLITINYFQAPAINIISPVEGYSTTSDSVTVFGTVNSTGLLFSVTVNGVDADLSLEGFNGTFTKTVLLSPGINAIYANVTDERGATNKTSINVTRTSPSTGSSGSSGESSGNGGSSVSSGSSGGGGGSPELQSNVEIKELAQQFVTNGNRIRFEFSREVTPVVYVEFDAKKSFGKTTTIIEELKGRSVLIPAEPEGEIYKYFNIWVGNGGVATPENVGNPVIGFKVEKSWLEENDILESSIELRRYNGYVWYLLFPKKVNEDDEYVYFEAETPVFSHFSITGVTQEGSGVQKSTLELVPKENLTDASTGTGASAGIGGQPVSGEGNAAGLDFRFVVMLLACAFLVVRRRS